MYPAAVASSSSSSPGTTYSRGPMAPDLINCVAAPAPSVVATAMTLSGDHVDEMIEPTSGRELPRRTNEFDELIGGRLTPGGNCELGDLLCVRLLARDGDRKAAFDEGLGIALGVEIR